MQSITAPSRRPVEMTIDERAEPRFTLLIRAGKLLVGNREYLCVVRDVSATGARIRGFHAFPKNEPIALEIQEGQRYAADLVWEKDNEAGFKFHAPINVDDVLTGRSDFPRRDLRFHLEVPAIVHSGGVSHHVELLNLSRQGGAIRTDERFATDQAVRLKISGIPEIEARVRWRKDGKVGLILDNTFSISNLALEIFRLQQNKKAAPNIRTETLDIKDNIDWDGI